MTFKRSITAILLALTAFAAAAQDKSLLETLVKKGALTQDEAADIAKQSVIVTPGAKDARAIKIKGGISAWYAWSQADIKTNTLSMGMRGKLPSKNGFDLRYVKFGIEADLGSGWSAEFMTDFGTEGSDRSYLDKVVISKRVDWLDIFSGQLDVGLRKVNFGQEQNMNDFGQLAIDRSIATYFFTRPQANRDLPLGFTQAKNFGSRAIGVFWDGKILQIDGAYYGLSIVGGNSYEDGLNVLSNEQGDNNLAFYANAGYKNSFTAGENLFLYDLGVNFGYSTGGYAWGLMADSNWENRGIWGFNPYLSLKWEGLTVLGEFFIQNVENGQKTWYYQLGRSATALPIGVNLTAAYKFNIGEWGHFEPVLRYSWVDTDGYGISGCGYNGDNIRPAAAPNIDCYRSAQSLYFGANWYFIPSVKFSLGYEWAYYHDNIDAPYDTVKTYSNTVRAQIQVLF